MDQATGAAAAAGPSGPAWGAASGQVVVGAIPQRSPGFLPRPVVLAQLARAGRGTSVLTGMRGVGKTQLAATYALAKLKGDWRLVAWINAGDSGSLLPGLAAVADAAGLSGGGSGLDAAAAGDAVRQLLEADGERCLLVFDDVEDPELVRPFVPAGGAAQVVITSTRPPAADLAASIHVDVFSAEEALAFLGGRTGLGEAGAAPVAAALGSLPLALAQAAGVIVGQKLRYKGYLKRLNALRLEEYLSPEQAPPYPRGVAESGVLSLDAVQVSDQTGVSSRVMAIMAVLSAAGVGRELLHATGQAGALASSGKPVPAAEVDQALDRLAELSLVSLSLDGRTVLAHRLATRVVREALARHGRLALVCRVAASVLEAYAGALAGSRDRPALRNIPEQVAALAGNTATLSDEADQELAGALLRLRFLALSQLIELGDGERAIAFGQQLTADLQRLLGRDHRGTIDAREGLATAYQSAGRSDVAIQMFELVLADRERVLGPDHPDTQTSRKNLAAACQDARRADKAVLLLEQASAGQKKLAAAYRGGARTAEAIPPVEQALTARGSQPAADAAEQVLASFRRPPADPARRALPVGFRRPPADPARQAFPKSFTLPAAKSAAHAGPGRTQEPPPADVHDDREVVAAIAAGDPAGIAMAYDRYAPALYGYCRWMLRDPADAAAVLQDIFVIAASAFSDLSDASKLRPWLYAVARSECRRRPLAAWAARDEKPDAANQQAEAADQQAEAADQQAEAMPDPADATVTFRAVRPPTATVPEMPDATMPFRALRPPPDPASALPRADGELRQAELRTLIRSILADLEPSEREAIELSFRHDLYDTDLAIALGVSWSRAHAQVSRAHVRLDEALGALRVALTRRDACPVLAELLVDWDGQLTEQTRDLVVRHIGECQTCANHRRGTLRPAALSHLLPLAPLPPELRVQVLSRCTSTAKDAVAYRRLVARHADPTWFSRFRRRSSM